jgi:nucleoid-associated protein YgaU
VNGIPVTGTTPTVGAVPASGTAPAPAAVGGPRPTTVGPNGTVPSSPSVAVPSGPVTPAASGPLGETTHTVASGETMSSIAKKYLGSENAWRTVAKANPTVDPTAMKIGTKLRIPAADQADATPASRAAAPAAASSAGGAETTHSVASGDTLASIARKYYGNTKHWERIYSENRSVIGSDPAALKIGQKLRIPAKSSVVTGESSRR